jgi:hypothetical protein
LFFSAVSDVQKQLSLETAINITKSTIVLRTAEAASRVPPQAYLSDIAGSVSRFKQWLKPGGMLGFNNPQVHTSSVIIDCSHVISNIISHTKAIEFRNYHVTLTATTVRVPDVDVLNT